MNKKLLILLAVMLTTLSATAGNTIYYTSVDGKVVTPYKSDVFGAKIISNTYEDGQGKIVFDGEVTSIGFEAFFQCPRLTSVEIPNSVTEIGGSAFTRCSRLTSMDIPFSVTNIGDAAFQLCTSLISFTGKFASEDHRCLIVYGVLNSFAPDGLTWFNIPTSVTSIGGSAFAACTSLTSVEIPNSVKEIGVAAFEHCYSLTSVNIPNSVTEIGKGAFSNTCLTSVEIPNSVTSIGEYAFQLCTSLKEIISLNIAPPTIGYKTFDKVDKSTCVLKVPTEAVEAYKAADGWKDFYNIEGITATDINSATIDGVQDGKTFNLQGQPVNDTFKGVVIRNGKKMLRK